MRLPKRREPDTEVLASQVRYDLGRGSLDGLVVPPLTLIRGESFTSVDFSDLKMNQVELSGLVCKDCTFSDVLMRDIVERAGVYDQCSFTRVDWSNSSLGFSQSLFADCTFNQCSFRGAGFGGPTFERCSFVDCRFEGADFRASSFRGCRFEGVVRDVWFRGGYPLPSMARAFGSGENAGLHDADFTHAVLRSVTFSNGCVLDGVRLPDDGRHRYIPDWAARLPSLAASQHLDVAAFARAHLPHIDDQSDYVLNRDDLEEFYGEDSACEILAALEGGLSPPPS